MSSVVNHVGLAVSDLEKSRRFYDLERLWRDAARVAIPNDAPGGEGSLRTER